MTPQARLKTAQSYLKTTDMRNYGSFYRPQRGILTTTILTSLLTTGAQGGYYAIFTWLPTFLRTERKLTATETKSHQRSEDQELRIVLREAAKQREEGEPEDRDL
jgi:hypothetical protein